MGSHSVTCHPTQVNASRLNPERQGEVKAVKTYGLKRGYVIVIIDRDTP